MLFKVLQTLWIRKEVLEKVTEERSKKKQSRNVEQTRSLLLHAKYLDEFSHQRLNYWLAEHWNKSFIISAQIQLLMCKRVVL